jgi:hypothetical protein
MELRACLDQCALGLLRRIAAAHEVPLAEPPARAEAVQQLLDRLLAPGYFEQCLTRLDQDERRALELVASDGGQLRGFVLERRLRHSPEPDGPDSTSSRVLGSLLQSGLLYRVFQAVGPVRGEVYVLPDELLGLLPSRSVSEAALPLAAEQPRETRRCSSSFSLLAMASFIRRWRQREAGTPQADGQLAALSRETGQLAIELPGRSARERWTLLAHIGLQLGLFARQHGGLQPTEDLEEWLALGEAGERRLWTAYVTAEQWNDLERAGSGAERFVGRTADPPAARAQVLDVVGSLTSEAWVLASDVERLVRARAPDFLREGFEVATSRLVDLESGEVLGGSGSWERVEAPLVNYLLAGPLFWLGVVEWGLGPDGWDRLRLTPSGRVWLDDSDEVLSPAPAPLKLSEESLVVASQRCDLRLLWQLEPYLDLERRGPPSEYRLTRASFAHGLEAGGSATDLRRLLERAVGGPPPLAFSLALERWSARAGRFRLKPFVVLAAEDAGELEELLDRPDISGLIRERLGPTTAAVAPARASELAEKLERMGHIPEVDAALRLLAGRRAYPALIDQHTLEALLFCLRLIKVLKPDLLGEVPNAERLASRLEQALGPIAAPRISRRARSAARRLRNELRKASGEEGMQGIAPRSGPVV